MTIDEFITKNKKKITSNVGYDSETVKDVEYIETFIKAGIEDMQENGVSDAVITEKSLAIVALTQYVLDNLQETPGNFTVSSIYTANVLKLRYMVVDTNEV